MTKTTNSQHDVPALITELDQAIERFDCAREAFLESQRFLGHHKGSLNEHQYAGKLESAQRHGQSVEAIVNGQRTLRASYFSGRLAFFAYFYGLVRQYDKLVRMIMKLNATYPNVVDFASRNLLVSRCLEAVHHANTTYREALSAQEKEAHRDLTEGRGKEALECTYQVFYAGGASGPFGEIGRLTTFGAVLPIFFAHLDMPEWKFAGEAESDRMVGFAQRLSSLITGEKIQAALTAYAAAKAGLNEPQYSQRLEAALLANKNEEAAALTREQNRKRLALMASYLEVNAFVAEASGYMEEIQALAKELVEIIEKDGKCGPNRKLIAKNNVLACVNYVRSANIHVGGWKVETANMPILADKIQYVLAEELVELTAQSPYRSLSWTCRGPGQYIEPL